MKRKFSVKSIVAITAITLVGASFTPMASANSSYGKAAGKYTGNLKGAVKDGPSIPSTPTTVKLPRKKGRIVVRINGAGSIKGRVKKAKCVQGGNKVIQTGTVKVPASQTGGLGRFTGPFRSVVKLGAGPPTMRATTGFKVFGSKITGKFTGSK